MPSHRDCGRRQHGTCPLSPVVLHPATLRIRDRSVTPRSSEDAIVPGVTAHSAHWPPARASAHHYSPDREHCREHCREHTNTSRDPGRTPRSPSLGDYPAGSATRERAERWAVHPRGLSIPKLDGRSEGTNQHHEHGCTPETGLTLFRSTHSLTSPVTVPVVQARIVHLGEAGAASASRLGQERSEGISIRGTPRVYARRAL